MSLSTEPLTAIQNHRSFRPVRRAWQAAFETSLRVHRCALLIGEPGCGKTTAAQLAAQELTGAPPEHVQGSSDTDRTSFWGLFTVAGGETRFCDGPLPRALKHGRHLLVEELTLIPPDALATILDIRGQMVVTNPFTGERIEVPSSFRLIATSNPVGKRCRVDLGPRHALLSDFHVHPVPALNHDDMRGFLQAHFPEAPRALLERVIQRYTDYRNVASESSTRVKPIGFRAAYHCLQLVQLGGMALDRAVEVAMVNPYVFDAATHTAAQLRNGLEGGF